ncbi:MAG TPA: DUF4384 domain-containing protein [Deinococcales bacterium]|nr:DUF4384 domain-containing protein [Deinococcales bacterium]
MKRYLLAGLALLGLGAAFASPARITPQSIIVNPAPNPQVGVRTWVDRTSYRIGQPIRISVSVTRDAYVYLFNINADGTMTTIFPNAYGSDNFMYAGQTRTFPQSGDGFTFTVSGPVGTDRVLAVASSQQLDMTDVYNTTSGDFYDVVPSSPNNLARALSIVVQPVPSYDWVTAITSYRVRY